MKDEREVILLEGNEKLANEYFNGVNPSPQKLYAKSMLALIDLIRDRGCPLFISISVGLNLEEGLTLNYATAEQRDHNNLVCFKQGVENIVSTYTAFMETPEEEVYKLTIEQMMEKIKIKLDENN